MTTEYQITLIPRCPMEENPLSMDAYVPTITPPVGDGWQLKHTLMGYHRIYLFWERTVP